MVDDDLLDQLLKYAVVVKQQIVWEDGIDEGVNRVFQAMQMLRDGSTLNEISIATGLSIDQVSQLTNSK